MALSDYCIVSAGAEHWYPQGVARLERSLIYHGWGGAMLLYKDYPKGCPSHSESMYAIKIYALREAVSRGYRKILWCDASTWAVKNPKPVFDFVNEKGFWAFHTGYNLVQTASDKLLSYCNLNNDDVANFPEHASGLFALNLDNPDGNFIWNYWNELFDAGLFNGSRQHDNQSADPRFLFYRQDQTCLNMALYKIGLVNKKSLFWGQYYPSTDERVIFFNQGM